ncbi:hypothetical protein BK708_05835 [Bacillus thuringiensis serovar yunnanensis]|nr:hypothetical protein BK708_05835 [Bacillus thuringiensis serovar yunnanensis]
MWSFNNSYWFMGKISSYQIPTYGINKTKVCNNKEVQPLYNNELFANNILKFQEELFMNKNELIKNKWQ